MVKQPHWLTNNSAGNRGNILTIRNFNDADEEYDEPTMITYVEDWATNWVFWLISLKAFHSGCLLSTISQVRANQIVEGDWMA